MTVGEWRTDYNKDKPANTANPITLFILLPKATAASEKAETPGTLEEEEQLVIVLVSWVRLDLVTVVVVALDEEEEEEERIVVVEEDFLWEIVVVTRGVEVVSTVETADLVTSGVVVIST